MNDTAKPTGPAGASERPPQQPGPGPAESGATDAASYDAAAASPEPAPTDAVVELQARVADLETQLETQVADLTDRLLRAHAEMDNVRKRTEREKADTARYAIGKFAGDIVGVSDNFQRAVAAVPAGAIEQDPALKSLVDGVLMSERAFLQVLEAHGVRPIDPKGEAFDPNRHQAVMEEQNADVAAGTVLKVFQSGYMIEDRVLRPAMVVVARGGFKPVKEPAGNGNGGGGAGPPG